MKKSCSVTCVNRTANGSLFVCTTCDKIHIEFKNLNFTFKHNDYVNFKKYFFDLDGEYWENMNQKSVYRRKISVPIGHANFTAMFNAEEVEELRRLFRHPIKKGEQQRLIKSDNISENIYRN